jgi:hypothetical protein
LAAVLSPSTAAAQTAIATQILQASDPEPGDAFGRRVAISGDTIVVGANADDERGGNAGAAYVFERDSSGQGVQQQKLLPSPLREGDFFGWSVAIDGDHLVVGAPGDDRDHGGTPNPATANRGAAYIYPRAGGAWTLQARIQPPELSLGDEFGGRVAVDDGLRLVSAIYRDLAGFGRLTAMVLDRDNQRLWLADDCSLTYLPAAGGAPLLAGGQQGLCESVDGGLRGPFMPADLRYLARFADITALADAPAGRLLVGEHQAFREVSVYGAAVNTAVSGSAIPDVIGLADDSGGSPIFSVLISTDGRLLRWTGWDTPLELVAGDRIGPPVDGTGAAATLRATALARLGSGSTLFVDRGNTVRHLAGATVTSLAGLPNTYPWTDYLHTYDVALQGNRMVVTSPRAPQMFTGEPRAGGAWVYEWPSGSLESKVPAWAVLAKGTAPFTRAGATAAFTAWGDVVLGSPNGCLWTAPGTCVDDAAGTTAAEQVLPLRIFRQDADGIWQPRSTLPVTGAVAHSGYGSALARDGRWLVAGAAEWDYRLQDPEPHGDIVGPGRVFVYDLTTLDSDRDTMPDDWESSFGWRQAIPPMPPSISTVTASPTRRSTRRAHIRAPSIRRCGTSPRGRRRRSSRRSSPSPTRAPSTRR